MMWKRVLITAGCLFCLGCNPPPAETPSSVDSPQDQSQVQRELVRVSQDKSGKLTVSEGVPNEDRPVQKVEMPKPGRADGVLGDDGNCARLFGNSPVFENPKAQAAWELFNKQHYTKSIEAFREVLAKESTLKPADRQKIAFLTALAIQRINPKADGLFAATDEMRSAYDMDAPLKHAAAVYGTNIAYQVGRWQDVVDFTADLLNNNDSRTYRVIALTNLGMYDAAASEFERIDAFPKSLRLDGLEARARAQSETAQRLASLETYRKIYEIDPNSKQGQIAQEAILSQKEHWPAGFTFPRSTQKSDKSKSAREIALGHFNAHRSEQAIQAYSKLLKDDKKRKDIPHVCDDLYAIGRSYVKLRTHSKAIPVYKEALTTCANTDLEIKLYYSGAKAAWNAGQNDLAIEWYQQIIQKYPKHSYADDACFYQAQILTSQGKLDEARNKLNEQISAYPDGDMAPDAYWMLMADLYDRGLYKQAIEFVDKHIQHAGESDLYSQGRLRYFQGRSYENVNNKTLALQNYLRILEEYPLSYYAMLSLGRIQHLDPRQSEIWIDTYRNRVYQPEQGLDYCFQAIHKNSEFSAARTLAQIGLYSDAVSEIEPLIDSTQAQVSFEAKLAKSMILQKMGKYSESARLAASLIKPNHDLENKSYAAWLLAYPKPWSDLVSSSANPESTLYYTTYAIMREESYYNPRAESWANARGLMQLMLPTAQSTAENIGMSKPSAQDLFKPEIAIPIGSAYIDKLNHILVPHPMFVLPGYNAGQGNVGKWMNRFADTQVDIYVEKIPFKEARHYAKRVGTTLWRYRWLYDHNLPVLFDPAQLVSQVPPLK